MQQETKKIRDSTITANLKEESASKITVETEENADQVALIEPVSPVSSKPDVKSRRSSSSPSISSMKKAKTFKRRKFGAKKKKKDPFDNLVYAVPGMTRN